MFYNYNTGVSDKTPVFLYPNSNDIEYFIGDIPLFNKDIIHSKIYSKYNFKFNINEIDKIESLMKENFNGFEIEINRGEIELSKTDYTFELYELIDIECFIEMPEGYEKACLGNAFACFPNDFFYDLDMIENSEEFYESDDEDEYYKYLIKEINHIKDFLIMNPREYKREKFKNPYTSSLIRLLFYFKPKLLYFIQIFDEKGIHNHRVKYYSHSTMDYYYNSELLREDYQVKLKLNKDFKPEFHKYDPVKLSDDFINMFSIIYNRWESYQTKL